MEARLVGVRAAGQTGGPLRWADPGDLVLSVGDRVVVAEQGHAWPAEVAVAAERIVEAPALAELPRVVRLAEAGEWPAEPERAGRTLLKSLDLPD